MRVLGIDPGSRKSGWVLCEYSCLVPTLPCGLIPIEWGHDANEQLFSNLGGLPTRCDSLAIETMPTVFGGAAARDQLEAERWAGQFIAAWKISSDSGACDITQIARATARSVATNGAPRAKDALVRRSIIDSFGGDLTAFGKKCKLCAGKGWRGRDHAPCSDCEGEGWNPKPGPLQGWTGSHVYAALAVALAWAQERAQVKREEHH